MYEVIAFGTQGSWNGMMRQRTSVQVACASEKKQYSRAMRIECCGIYEGDLTCVAMNRHLAE